MRLALIVEYDGTAYHGFQFQVNAPSIQEELENAIASLTGEKVRIKGAGRTDAGVHARGQVVAFDTASSHSVQTFVRALNYYLAEDIAVRAAHTVGRDFDPRRDALSRTYRYTIVNNAVPSPLMRRYACNVREKLDTGIMAEAASLFVGVHDFVRFCGPTDDKGASTVRQIYEIHARRDGESVMIDVVGSAFLPHQVRRMAGALVDVGRGKISIDDIKQMIEGKQTKAIAHTLPAQGLCLMEVSYDGFPPIA